ncbi:uncharacterized protein BT62DRAFT_1078903 [Guyanagaster necrorhizus]|uniref:Uncharacterized protein n=1 Tax=Guyanagaster necrorhizus TaxID=856835 RepID=A0A9P8AQE6_9AGAR|nr:uncharacterized protein BT62DRAFT_1078903 [Guyanagaster necrorhizus MCA 3950]KAG7442792.1 hypothetical protein BT62DRAFT_1078903 [Guyanagaster necrorhizus MCA 3950]
MGGYQAELYFLAVGLDIREKLDLLRTQLVGGIDESRYLKFSLEAYGTCSDDPKSQLYQAFLGSSHDRVWRIPSVRVVRILSGKSLNATSKINVKVHVEDMVIPVGSVVSTEPFDGQDSYDPKMVTDLSTFGPTTKTHLGAYGKIVLERSGDKGGNVNVGLWDYKPEYRIERFEMTYVRAVDFITYGILEDGISSTSVLGGLAKSFGEFI